MQTHRAAGFAVDSLVVFQVLIPSLASIPRISWKPCEERGNEEMYRNETSFSSEASCEATSVSDDQSALTAGETIDRVCVCTHDQWNGFVS